MKYLATIGDLAEDYQDVLAEEDRRYEHLISRYRSDLATIDQIYHFLPDPLIRPLTIPRIFGKEYDENFISDCLAYMLDPRKNGIGKAPLSCFLELIPFDGLELSLETVDIYRERMLGSGRIDLLILIDDSVVVGIENKIGAEEGERQTLGYAETIESEFEDFSRYYVFLSPEGRKAESDKFRSMSYSQLVEVLRTVQYAWMTDVRKSAIWEDLLTHLEVYIAMGRVEPELSEKSKLYLRHYEMLADLQSAYKSDSEVIFDFIKAEICSNLKGGDWDYDFQSSRSWQLAWKYHWKREQFWIMYQYHLSRDWLLEDRYVFSLEVQGYGRDWSKAPQIDEFMKLFVPHYSLVQDRYESLGIEHRPPQRRTAIAWKEYPVVKDTADFGEQFIVPLCEFDFLIEYVDLTLEEFGS